MHKRSLFALISIIWALAGCGRIATTVATPVSSPTAQTTSSTSPAQPANATSTLATSTLPLNQPFTLRVGQRVRVGTNLSVVLDRIAQDSRCPKGVACVWAGAVTSEVTLQQDGQEPKHVSISYPSLADSPDHADYMGMTIQLLKIEPNAASKNTTIASDMYMLTFTVVSTSGAT